MILKKQIPQNLMTNYFATGINMLLGLLIIPFLIKKLGKDAFGLVILAESIVAFLELATIGIRLSLSRHATFSFSQDKNEDFLEYLSTSRYILLGLAAVIAAIGLGVALNFPRLFHVPDLYVGESKKLFSLITLSCVVTTVNIVFWSVLYVKQRMDLVNIAASSGVFLRAVGIFVLFSLLPKPYITLTTYGFIYLVMVCARESLIYVWHKKLIPGIKLSLKYFRVSKIREMASFGAFSTIGQISAIFNDQAANVIVNIFWGAGFNAIYGVGLKFPMMMKRLFLEPTWVLTPTFTHLAAKNDKARLETIFFMYTKIISIITIPLCLILIYFARPIILIWVGSDFSPAIDILRIQMVSLLVALPFCVSAVVNNAYARVKIPSFISLAAAASNIALCIILGKIFSLGLVGIAMASAIPTFLAFTLFAPYYSCKTAGLSLKQYLIKTFLLPCMWAFFIYGAWFVSLEKIKFSISTEGFLIFYTAVTGLILTAAYGWGVFIFLLNGKEKGYIKEILRNIIAGTGIRSVVADTHINP